MLISVRGKKNQGTATITYLASTRFLKSAQTLTIIRTISIIFFKKKLFWLSWRVWMNKLDKASYLLLWHSLLNFTMFARTAAVFNCRSWSVRNHITLTGLKQSSPVWCCNTRSLCGNTSMTQCDIALGVTGQPSPIWWKTQFHWSFWMIISPWVGDLLGCSVTFALPCLKLLPYSEHRHRTLQR